MSLRIRVSSFQFPVSSFLLLVLVLFHSDKASGDEFRLIPFVALKEEYTEYADDVITTLSPGLRLTERTERLDASLSARMDRIRYAENSAFNALDHHYTGEMEYWLSERMRVFSEAAYTKDSRRDRDMEETGLVLGTAIRNQYYWDLSGTYLLSEITEVTPSYVYSQDNFDDPEFADCRSDKITLGLIHHLGYFVPLMKGRMNFGYARYDFTSAITENYSWTVGASWELSETLSLLVHFGGRYTLSEFKYDPASDNNFTDGNIPYTEKDWGTTGRAELSSKGERIYWKFTLSQDLKTASGKIGTTERTKLAFNLTQSFTEAFQASLSASYYLNVASPERGEYSEKHTLRISPRARYDLTKDISFEASYTFTAVMDREADTITNQNVIFGRIIFLYPLFE